MRNASFDAQVSNLCRELVQAKNDLERLEDRKREIEDILEERTIVLRSQRIRPRRFFVYKSGGNKIH